VPHFLLNDAYGLEDIEASQQHFQSLRVRVIYNNSFKISRSETLLAATQPRLHLSAEALGQHAIGSLEDGDEHPCDRAALVPEGL
jgi:hypothetical protein